MVTNGWIGCDFDGTLVEQVGPPFIPGVVGRPIALMINRVKRWLAQGKDVRIVTARVSNADIGSYVNRLAIENFCKQTFGIVLLITSEKDPKMIELWDDCAIQLIPNTGIRVDGQN